MSSIAVPQSEIWLPEKRRFRLPKFEPWRLLRPLNMDGQFFPKQRMQFQGGPNAIAVEESHPASTKLMLHMDGTDGSTSFTDFSQSARTVTASGTAQVDTAQSKWGGASLLVDGNSDFLTVAGSSDFHFGAYWSVEGQIRLNALPSSGNYMCIAACGWGNSPIVRGWFVGIHNDGGTYKLKFFYSTNGTNTNEAVANSLESFTTGTWYHFCVARMDIRLYAIMKGGNGASSTSFTTSIYPSSEDVTIGACPDGHYFNGWIDELRIATRPQYILSTYTEPTQAYPYYNDYHDPGLEAYTNSGTFTWTIPNYKTQLQIDLYGGGGGGGGAGTTGNTGSSGAATTITSLSLSAGGGSGGAGRTTTGVGAGGAGGTASGGDTNTSGEAGNTDGNGEGGDAPGTYGGVGGGLGGSSAAGVAGTAAGGGGGGGSHFGSRAGGGGGSGSNCVATYSPGELTPGNTLTIVTGAGGNGGTGTYAGGAGANGRAIMTWS